ncbi:MAG: N-acetylmuramoyl-L-alanine amidase [Clostridiales bacterium]|nr:N-acetylmuramoyl-L-alanine amidase [Clostridiales bacterium]
MSLLYLSPSTQEFNPYVTGGNEEQYMNLIADQMEPYLRASGITVTRNRTDMTAAQCIKASNEGNYDLHLALHSNAAPEFLSGTLQGSVVYYYPGSTKGRRFAELAAAGLREIYPDPELVSAEPTTAIGEVTKVKAPAVLIELAYHDNTRDAIWLQTHTGEIAQNVSGSVAAFFDLPFLTPQPARKGTVDLNWGSLNIREQPSTTSTVLASAYDGAELTVWNEYQGWYVVEFAGMRGFAWQAFVSV